MIKKGILISIIFSLHCYVLFSENNPPLQLISKINLKDVRGRLDHMALDLKKQRLFIAELGNNTVEVVDLKTNSRLILLPGFAHPQGILLLPEMNKFYVTNAERDYCYALDLSTYNVLAMIKIGNDNDNIRYDPANNKIYIAYGHKALAVLDPGNNLLLNRIDLNTQPESFQIEKNGARIFVNLPQKQSIAVIDKNSQQFKTEWPLTSPLANYTMALDEEHQRLFVASFSPASLIVVDTQTGKPVATVACIKDVDDMFYDPDKDYLFLSGGEGFLQIFDLSRTPYQEIARVPTGPGARTSLWSPELRQLFVAVPFNIDKEATILVFQDGK